MKKTALILFFLVLSIYIVQAQCSLCTKTAQQLGEKPSLGLNSGILYLMLAPFGIVCYIGYRWFRTVNDAKKDDQQLQS